MASYKGHLIGGFISVIILLIINQFVYSFLPISLSFKSILLIIFITAFYSIVPDYDILSSKISRIIIPMSILGIIYCLWFRYVIYGIVLGIIILLPFFLKHRGVFHTITAGLILSSLLYFIGWVYIPVGFVGFLSHLVLDKEIKLI